MIQEDDMSNEGEGMKGKAAKLNKRFNVVPRCVIKEFDGKGYPLWMMRIKNLLRECHLLKYIDAWDNITDYDADEDMQALAKIQYTLSDMQACLTLNSMTAYDAWVKLKDKHLHSSESNRMFLKNQFTGLRMKDGETMTEFIARIDNIAQQLSSLSEEQVKEEEKACVLTQGLPESYRHIIVTI